MLHIATELPVTQLLELGYKILPNKGKQCFLPGWNDANYSSDIRRLEQAETLGVRIEDGLAVIDIDVNDPLAKQLFDYIGQIAPEIADRAPMRYGVSAHKAALFVRLADDVKPFRHYPSDKYAAPDEIELAKAEGRKPKGHMVEIFGGQLTTSGNCTRQFGIYGAYTNEDGKRIGSYHWEDGPQLHEVAPDKLPVLTLAVVDKILLKFHELAEAAGWRKTTPAPPPSEHNSVVYDITEASRFDTWQHGDGLSYEELCAAYDASGDVRCSSSFFDPNSGGNRQKCQVFHHARHDCVMVFDYKTYTVHLPADKKPADPIDISAELKALQNQMQGQPSGTAPPKPSDDASLEEKAAWLVITRGFMETDDRVVVLHEPSDNCRVTLKAMLTRFGHWVRYHKGPRGGLIKVTAVGMWYGAKERVSIDGVQMRPDQPFERFQEAGRTIKNTYRKPVHEGAGQIEPFLVFMDRLVPDKTEREWLFDWLAHKQARPEIPGACVFFVADDTDDILEGTFGTGRGLLFSILHRLYGREYTKAQLFSVLDGSSSQSAYNDWMHGAVLVTVDEAQASPTAHRHGHRRSAYEVLKDIVDPAPKQYAVHGKYRQSFQSLSCTSLMVASNHADAMAIPPNDRRFSILRNGRPILPEEARAIAAWRDETGNIAALSRFLAARDLTGFNMFEALATVGKAEMAELSRTAVEEFMVDISEDEDTGKVFTREQLRGWIMNNPEFKGSHLDGHFEAAWRKLCCQIKGKNGGPMRVRTLGTRRKLFCFRSHLGHLKTRPDAAIFREAKKWGGLETIGPHVVDPGDTDGPTEKIEE